MKKSHIDYFCQFYLLLPSQIATLNQAMIHLNKYFPLKHLHL